MNAKVAVFDICVEASIYFLLCNLYDCIFNGKVNRFSLSQNWFNRSLLGVPYS